MQVLVQNAERNYKSIIPLSSKGGVQMNDTTVYFGDFELIIDHPLCNKGLLSGSNDNKGSMRRILQSHLSAIKEGHRLLTDAKGSACSGCCRGC